MLESVVITQNPTLQFLIGSPTYTTTEKQQENRYSQVVISIQYKLNPGVLPEVYTMANTETVKMI